MIKKIFSKIFTNKFNLINSIVLILLLLFSTTKAKEVTKYPIRLFAFDNQYVYCQQLTDVFQKEIGYLIPSNESFQFTGFQNNRSVAISKNCLSVTTQNPFLDKKIKNQKALNGENFNFYKTNTKASSIQTLEKHRIWLNLTNTSSANFSQALMGYIEGATDGYDSSYDALLFGDNQHSIYSILNNESYTIQAFALPFEDTDVIPLGITTTESGTTTIAIDHVDGLFLGNQPIYLEDLLLNITYDIKTAPYVFESAIGTFNNRFLLRFNNLPLSTINQNNFKNIILYAKNQEIKIKSNIGIIKKVTVYDVLGRQIFENNNINKKDYNVSQLTGNQNLIVKITLETGEIISKKIVNQ